MILCARIIKQEGATRQAERKSMNKTKAFSRANHDVRASLAAITGLIEMCHQDAKPNSELAANLGQMDTCTKDLLGKQIFISLVQAHYVVELLMRTIN